MNWRPRLRERNYMVSENPLWYLPQTFGGKNIHKNIGLLHSFATGLEYLVVTSGHKQPSSFLLLRDLKAPCHNKATGTPQQFLQKIYIINFLVWIKNKDVHLKVIPIKFSRHKWHAGKLENQVYSNYVSL